MKSESVMHGIPFRIGPSPILIQKEILDGGPSLETYRKNGGYQGLIRAVTELSPAEVIGQVRDAGLRGRGGSGFPTALKWEKVSTHRLREKYVVANGSEGEPGSHKDHFLIDTNPHQILEGIVIASYAVQAQKAFFFIKESFPEGIQRLLRAKEEAQAEGLIGKNILGSQYSVDVEIFVGPSAYIAGEETALLEALEGRPPRPRPKPPYYPTDRGLYNAPTVVNNVETYAHVSHILRNGPVWFKERGLPKSPGTMVFAVTGSIRNPLVVELPLGTSLRTLIEEYAGGPLPGETITGFYPGGPSFGILPHKDIDVALDYDSLRSLGSGIGSGGVIVLSDKDCPVATATEFSRFYETGSCGQCPPCRIGTENIHDLLDLLEDGKGSDETVKRILRISEMIKGRGNCGLITASAYSVETLIKHFPEELSIHLSDGSCSRKHRTPYYQKVSLRETLS
ncbi:MAG: complex I 51 kDa subunit family protein [Leptospirales bacterium]